MAKNVLEDGYQTLVGFASNANVKFTVKKATPPGVDGGGGIDVTTMENSAYRTMSPKSLMTVTNSKLVVAYDPAVYDDIIALVNVNNLITVTFPDGATLGFYGFLDKFTPSEHVEGEQPTAECEIVATLVHSSTGAETAPDYTAPV